MSWWSTLYQCIEHELNFITWRDSVEILFFSLCIYYFLLWLSHDKQKNLIFWFYGYSITLITAHFTQLNSVKLVMLAAAPIVLIMFIVLHQQTLQKNFIALKNITPSKKEKHYHWLKELMQASLHCINKQREIIYIIERNDSINNFFSTSYQFNAQINHKTLDLLINTDNKKQATILWVNHAGKLISINPHWKKNIDETWASEDIKALHQWKQNAIFISKKTDALVFALTPRTRLFDIIIDGKTINQMNASDAFSLLKKYNNLSQKKDQNNAPISSKNNAQQKYT